MNSAARWIYRVTGKKKLYVLILTLSQGISGVLGVFFALFIRNIVDSAVARDSDAFWRNVILIISLVVVQLAIAAFNRWMIEYSKSKVENLLKERLLDNILRKNYCAVSATHTAEWINRLTNDTVVVAGGFIEILPGLIGMFVRLVSAIIMIIAIDRWFLYILVPGGIAVILLTYVFRKRLKRLHKNIQESDGRLRIFLQERIGNLMLIKSFAAEKETGDGANEKMEDHRKARLKRNRFSNVANSGFGTAMYGMYLIGIIYCAYGILMGRLSYGTLAAVMQLIGQIQTPFANLSGYLPRWYSMTASAERLMEIESFKEDLPAASYEEMDAFYQKDFAGTAFHDVCFSYPAEEAPDVLKNLNLTIQKGETVAFTGHSGCGKSTVLKLLLSMYLPDSGTIGVLTKDGEKELTSYYRRLFAYVPQGNALMDGSLRSIISFTHPEEAENDERLRKALTIACADDFAQDLDLVLGERGTGLSEGQMQRIAIARAIFSESPILLLDEATSALDEETERRLLENLRSVTDKTVLIVTHRKAALSICDRVLHFTNEGVNPQ